MTSIEVGFWIMTAFAVVLLVIAITQARLTVLRDRVIAALKASHHEQQLALQRAHLSVAYSARALDEQVQFTAAVNRRLTTLIDESPIGTVH